MKEFVLKRPLFCSCVFSAAVSAACAFIGCRGMSVLFFAFIFLLFISLPVKSKLRLPAVVTLAMSVLIVITSFIYQYFRYEPIKEYNDKTVSVNATVLQNDGEYAVLYCDSDLDGNTMGFKVKIKPECVQELVPSSKIKLSLTFYSADRNEFFANDGVHIMATAQDVEVVSGENTSSVIYLYYKIRKKTEALFTMSDEQASAFVKGMVLGDKSDISGIFSNMFSEVGLSHVMSVSGMHLMFAVVFLDFMLAFLGVHYKKRSLISIAAALVFTFFSGFSVTCVRSFIMLAIYYFGRFSDKLSDSLTSLSFSAYLILLVAPYNIGNISFMLSVLATFGMIIIAPVLNSIVPVTVKNRVLSVLLHALKNSVTVSLGANIACLPVLILCFKSVSLISPLSNIILMIPIQAVFYLSFVFLLCLPFPPLGKAVSAVISALYNVISRLVEYIYNLKYISVNDGNIFFYFVFALLAVLVLGIYLYQRKNMTKKIYPYIAAYAFVCVVMFCASFVPSNGKVKLSVVDVGHGSTSVIAKDERAVIVDCGGENMDELFTVLRRYSVKNIDLIALTHTDSDHVNFISYLINHYKVDKIVYPEFCDIDNISEILQDAFDLGIEISALEKDESLEVLNGAKVHVFVEKAYNSKITSNTSALYKFEYGPTSVCYTGDMSISQEYVYTKYGNVLDCDILLVPHHGSAKSCLKSILEIYSPDYSVISISEDNQYGLPDERIVSRLQSLSSVLSTAECSTVEFILDEKGYKLLNK